MRHFDYSQVSLDRGYLKEKQELNRKITIHSVYDRFYDTGRIGTWDFTWKEGMPNKPHIFYDSDIAKWMEGACYILKNHPEETLLREQVEHRIDRIEQHQGEDGYFNSYYTVCEPDNRFTVRDNHELYCAGHLIEAAVAYTEATGNERFLRCMRKYADYIYRVFYEEKSAAFFTPGHEEIEIALLRLYRLTKEQRYLTLAKSFIDQRGLREDHEYSQSHKPVREQTEAVGHAVRAVYLYTAMADLARETGDEALAEICRTLYRDITERKMYVTGGIGSVDFGEAFSNPYDLPNEKAYTETCAGIGLMFFCRNMMTLENKATYADTIERVLYNGVLSGLSLDGKAFFYENPLEINRLSHFTSSFGSRRLPITQRLECFGCSCCPPNINRLLAKLGEYLYALDGDTLYVNQYAQSRLDSGAIRCSVKTAYPLDGEIVISASGVSRVAVRIPSWCRQYSLNKPYSLEEGYAVVENDGGDIVLSLDVSPFAVQANARVLEDNGKLCVQAGPVVYCAEAIDNGENLHALLLSQDFACRTQYDPFFGLNVIEAEGYRIENSEKSLYSKASLTCKHATVKLIPYNSFANRGESDMMVWLRAKL